MDKSENMLKTLRGVVVNYRMGPKAQRSKEYIVQFADVKSANQASRFLGRKIAWPVGKCTIRGKIVAVHGKNGRVIVRFRKGLPGQTGIQIEIIG